MYQKKGKREAREITRIKMLEMRPQMVPQKTPDAATLRRLQKSLLEHFSKRPEGRKAYSGFKKGPRWSVNRATECWEWLLCIDKKSGYGQTYSWEEKKLLVAHKYLYILTFGRHAEGLELDHLCRNRKCVNPFHLEAVPRSINALRGDKTVLTPEIVIGIIRDFDRSLSKAATGRKYGISAEQVRRILNGTRWNWLTGQRAIFEKNPEPYFG